MIVEINIRDISKEFCKFWDTAKDKSFEEKSKLWKELYEEPNRDVFDNHLSLFRIVVKDFQLEDRYEYSFNRYNKEIENINAISCVIEEKINETVLKCKELFEVSKDNPMVLNFITMVGLYFGDGWVSTFKDKPTTFFAMERMPSPNNLGIFLAHEITHCIHQNLTEFSDELTLAERLFIEGFAVLSSEILNPGQAPVVYLKLGSDDDAWYELCKKKWQDAKKDIVENLYNTTDEYVAKYFMDGDAPTRSGYTYGYFMVKKLSESYPLSDMIQWKRDRMIEEVEKIINQVQINN